VTITAERPGRTTPAADEDRPRQVRRLTTDDWLSLWGAVFGSLAVVDVGFEHILDGSGTLGFGVCWYLGFLLMYAALVGLSNPRPVVVDRLVTTAAWLAGGIVVFALATTVVFTFSRGHSALAHLNFFTDDMSGVSPTSPLSQGGIFHAIVGSAVEVGIATAVAVPLGIGTAVYMAEIGGRGSRLVRTVVEAMTALPEILAGLFVYVVLIVGFGLPKSGIAASAAMTVTMIPIIARAAEVALRVVPGGLREASLALGASRWRTVRQVVLPSARAGLATATILGLARGVGETAVVLITSGASSYLTVNPTKNPMNSLPLLIFTDLKTAQPLAIDRAFGAASVLLAIVLVLFVATRVLSRDKTGRR
jgi:phosphate transport system permease protein